MGQDFESKTAPILHQVVQNVTQFTTVESSNNGLQETGEKVHLNESPSYRGFHQMGKIHGF